MPICLTECFLDRIFFVIEMKLVLRNTSGETVSLYIQPEETFQDLKQRVQTEVGIALDLQDLTIKGKNISDSQRVIDYFTSPGRKQTNIISQYDNPEAQIIGARITKSCKNLLF
jgi:hypothetical protein